MGEQYVSIGNGRYVLRQVEDPEPEGGSGANFLVGLVCAVAGVMALVAVCLAAGV